MFALLGQLCIVSSVGSAKKVMIAPNIEVPFFNFVSCICLFAVDFHGWHIILFCL